jgi:hypothetical protein
VRKCYLGFSAVCALVVNIIGCSPTPPPNFVAIDPTKRSDTWALQRADIDCKAQVRSEKWFDHLRLRHRVDPIYVSCMQQKGYLRPQDRVSEAAPSATTASSASPILLRPADVR